MRRPIVPLVVVFLSGIGAAELAVLPAAVWLIGAPLAAGLTLLSSLHDRPRLATLFLLILFFSLGAGRLEVERRLLPSNHVDRLPEEMLEGPLRVEGIVVSPTDPLAGEPRGAESASGRIRILLDLHSIWPEGREIEVRGRARLTLLQPQIVPAYGDRIRGLVKLRRPRGYLNPGGFDYPLHLKTMGVTLEGWVGEGDPLERRGSGAKNILRAWAYTLRARMIRAVNQLLPHEQASLLTAIILGERTGISPQISQAFLDSGTYCRTMGVTRGP